MSISNLADRIADAGSSSTWCCRGSASTSRRSCATWSRSRSRSRSAGVPPPRRPRRLLARVNHSPPDCGYRIDDRTLAELLAGHPELAAGLAAIAAARRAALEAQAGGSSAPAAGRRAAEPTAGLIQRLLGRW